MITAFDLVDAGMAAAVLTVAVIRRAWFAQAAIMSLVLYHVFGRAVAWQSPDPLPVLGMAATAIASGYLFRRC